MTITLGSLRITRFVPQIDQAQRTQQAQQAQQAQQIITSDYFQTLRQQAALIRAERL